MHTYLPLMQLQPNINNFFFFGWKDPRETQQYFPTFVDGRGGKPPAILAEDLTPEDSRLEPVTSPRTERVYARLTNWANPWGLNQINNNQS